MSRNHTSLLAAAALAAALIPASRSLGALAASTFDTDADGWTVTDDPGTTLSFTPTDGNPPGAAVMNEVPAGRTDYFVAPSKFLGDLTSNFGGTLRFDVKPTGDVAPDTVDGDLILSGPAGTLFGFLPVVPIPGRFTTETFTLASNADIRSTHFRFNSATGDFAFNEQIQAVLANVTSLKIRGDFVNGTDTTTLDNVFLAPGASPGPVPIPTPAALPAALTVLAALPLAHHLRRRRSA
jgi:hypothetical protein